jgi:hypothetical protein
MYEVGDTPLRITPNGSHSGMDITIQNQGPAAVYLGVDNTLTNTNYGYKIAANQAFSVELPGNDALYVYAIDSGATISTLQLSLEQGA